MRSGVIECVCVSCVRMRVLRASACLASQRNHHQVAPSIIYYSLIFYVLVIIHYLTSHTSHFAPRDIPGLSKLILFVGLGIDSQLLWRTLEERPSRSSSFQMDLLLICLYK